MNPLLDSFNEFKKSGSGSGLFLQAIEQLQQSYFRTVKAKSPQYFILNGYACEEDFMDNFYMEFIEKKLYDRSVWVSLDSAQSDSLMKGILYYLIKQYYNTAYMSPAVVKAKTVLDTIIGKMRELKLVETDSKSGTRNTMFITVLSRLEYQEILDRMTPQFRNTTGKYSALYKTVDYLNASGRARYYDLINLIVDLFEENSAQTDDRAGGLDDDNELGAGSAEIFDEPAGDEPIDWTKINFDDGPENPESDYSYLEDITPVAPENVLQVSPGAEELFSEMMLEGENSPKRVRLLINLILKEAGVKKVEAFMLTWLLRGDLAGPIPIEVRERVYKILDIRSSAFYERYDGFQKSVKSIMRLRKHSFEHSELVSAMVIFYKVYKRKCVI